jgi:glycosyltransferase involved in cell wall biosynthesis
MKILFYSHTGEVSGAENILLLLLKKLNRQRFNPVGVCPPEGGLADEMRKLNVPCQTVQPLEARFTWRIDLLFKYLFSFYATIKEFRREILKAAPNLIHANSIRAGLVATSATVGTKIPVFWHLQDELKPHPISTAIRIFVACSKRTRLIPASQATADSFYGKLLKRFGKNVPLRVVHNAIELERFESDPAHRTKIREEFNLNDSEYLLGIIGQITPRKGQLELVRTFAETLNQTPNSTLLIVGKPMFNKDHEYLREIKEAIDQMGLNERVKLLGLRSDVPAIMQALDVLVINSKSEALVVVGIEAMACGTPVIATDAGGTREMIEHRENGLIVNFGDDRELKNSIIELSHNPGLRKKFSTRGKEVVTQKLNAQKFISDLEDFFCEFVPQEQLKGQITNSGNIKTYV